MNFNFIKREGKKEKKNKNFVGLMEEVPTTRCRRCRLLVPGGSGERLQVCPDQRLLAWG